MPPSASLVLLTGQIYTRICVNICLSDGFGWLIISRSILFPSPSPGATASKCCTCLVLMDIKVIRWDVIEYALQSVLLNLHRILISWLPDWGAVSGHDLSSSTCLSSPSLFFLSPKSTCQAPASCRMMFFWWIQHVTHSLCLESWKAPASRGSCH